MGKEIRVYFDKDADFLEVLFSVSEGDYEKTENKFVMKKIDKKGKLVGFSIFDISIMDSSLCSFTLQEEI
ncbi:MAG: DUF2283 domain-containing protein [Leptospiraceae bacterium]|nr:DUF2283 domain-containing protein [Leptospiraceae bacterium]